MEICSQCGETLKEFSKFCFKCGHRIEDTVSNKLILNSLSSVDSQKLFSYLNARLNSMERKVDSHLDALKRFERILVDKNILSPKDLEVHQTPQTSSIQAHKVEDRREPISESKAGKKATSPTHQKNLEVPVASHKLSDIKELESPLEETTEVESLPVEASSESLTDSLRIQVTSGQDSSDLTVEQLEATYKKASISYPQLPTPEFFPFKVEYNRPIPHVPLPSYSNRTTKMNKRSLLQKFKDFVEYQGVIAGALISILLVMLLGAWVLFQGDFVLQSTSLSFIGAFMIGVGALLLSGKLGRAQYNLGIGLVNFGFLLSLSTIMALFQTGDPSTISYFLPYLLFILEIVVMGVGLTYSSNITAMSLSAFVPIALNLFSYSSNYNPLFSLGGLLWYIPLTTMVLIYGIREDSFYPSITLSVTGLISITGYNSAYVAGHILIIFASILPFAVLLDRGKVELLRPYLILSYLFLFTAPLASYLALYYRGMLSSWDSLGFMLGVVVIYQVATTEITRGGFRRSLLFSSVLREMQIVARYAIPLSGIIAATIFGMQIRTLSQDEYYRMAFIPGLIMVFISIVYSVSIFHRSLNKPTYREIFAAIAMTETTILIVSGNLVNLSNRFNQFTSTIIFATIALVLPLTIGVLGQYASKYLYYSGSFLIMSNWLTVVNSFILTNAYSNGSESVLFASIGLMIFPISIFLPGLSNVSRRQNYEVALISNTASLLITQYLGNYRLKLTQFTDFLGIEEFGPFVVFGLYVLFSGLAFYMLSNIAPERIEKKSETNLLLNSTSEIMRFFENFLLRNQELSFSLFINLTFGVFSVTGAFMMTNSTNLFLVTVLLMLLLVNLVMMFLTRGRHWATIIPVLLPYISTAYVAGDSLSLTITLGGYSLLVFLTSFLVLRDSMRQRTDTWIRSIGRDVTIWIGFYIVLALTEVVDPIVYLVVIMVVSVGSGMNIILARSGRVSGFTLAIAGFILPRIVPAFTYSLFPEIQMSLISAAIPLVIGSIANIGVNYSKDAKEDLLISFGNSSMVIVTLTLGQLMSHVDKLGSSTQVLAATIFVVNLGYVITRIFRQETNPIGDLTFILMGFQLIVLNSEHFVAKNLLLVTYLVPILLMVGSKYWKGVSTPLLGESIAIGGIVNLFTLNQFDLVSISILALSTGLLFLKYTQKSRVSLGLGTFLGGSSLLSLLGNFGDVSYTLATGSSQIEIGVNMIIMLIVSTWLIIETSISSGDKYLEVGTSAVAFLDLLAFVIKGVDPFIFQMLMGIYTVAVALYEYRSRSIWQLASSISVLAIPLANFGSPEQVNLLIFYTIQALIAIVNVEKKRLENKDFELTYYGLIVISSIYVLLANFSDPLIFIVSATSIGLIYLIYESLAKAELKIVSLMLPIVLFVKLLSVRLFGFLGFSNHYMINFMDVRIFSISASIQILMSIAFLAYSKRKSGTTQVAVLSLSTIPLGIISLADSVVMGLPFLVATYLLWRSSSERINVILSAYQLGSIFLLNWISAQYAAVVFVIFVMNFLIMSIQVLASTKNIYSSQKFLMGVNLVILGGFVDSTSILSQFVESSLRGYLDYIWIFLLILFQGIVILDFREEGFTLFPSVEGDGLISRFFNHRFSSIEDTVTIMGIIQSSIFILWARNLSIAWIVPILLVEGPLMFALLVTTKGESSHEGRSLMIISITLMVVSTILNILAEGFITTFDYGFGQVELPVWVSFIYLLPIILGAIYNLFANIPTNEEKVLDSSIGLFIAILSIALSILALELEMTGIFPALIGLALISMVLGVISMDNTLTILSTIIYYVTGFMYGTSLLSSGLKFPQILGMSNTAVIMLSLALFIYILSVWMETKFELGDNFAAVIFVTILVMTYFGFTANNFATSVEKMLAFISLAFSSSMSYWYGVRYSRDRIKYLGLTILISGFVGGMILSGYYLLIGTLIPITAFLSFVSSTIAFLFVIGVRQINKGKHRRDILRLLQSMER